MELNDRVSALKDLFFETNLFRTTGSRCVLHEDNAGIQFELPATRPRDARKFLTYLQQKFQLAKVDFKIKDPDPADITQKYHLIIVPEAEKHNERESQLTDAVTTLTKIVEAYQWN